MFVPWRDFSFTIDDTNVVYSNHVILHLSIYNSVEKIRIANDAGFSINDTGWISPAAQIPWELTAGTDIKTVYLMLSNETYGISYPVLSNTVDVPAMSSLGFTINNNATIATNTNVTLQISGSNANMMMVANNSDFSDGVWENFTTNKNWALSADNTTNRILVYMKFTNTYFKTGSIVYSNSIYPVYNVPSFQTTYINNTNLEYSMANPGLYMLQISTNPDLSGVNWIPVDGDIDFSWTNDGLFMLFWRISNIEFKYTSTIFSNLVRFWIFPKNDLVDVPGGTYIQSNSIGSKSFTHTVSSFKMATYEITYDLWYKVYNWALVNGYTFDNSGREGANGVIGAPPTVNRYEPVTWVNWRDVIVWCNAYSEISALTPCYTNTNGLILRSSTNANECDYSAFRWDTDGFRLPTEGEWQYAASYIDGVNWQPKNFASGAYTYFNDTNDVNPVNGIFDGKEANDEVAVYNRYYNGTGWSTTGVTNLAQVGTKTANSLGIYDMSGNVNEWCWDFFSMIAWPTYHTTNFAGTNNNPSVSEHVFRGGSFGQTAENLQVGYPDSRGPHVKTTGLGFRVIRN